MQRHVARWTKRIRISNIEHEARGAQMLAQFLVEWYAGGVIFRVLKLGYLAARGHQVYKAGTTLPYVFRGGAAGRSGFAIKQITSQVENFSFELCKMTKSFGAKLEYAAGLGYKITIPQSKRHNIVIRIMQEGSERSTPYIRWSDRNGALNVLGESMSDRLITHFPLNSTIPEKMSELIKLILSK